MKPLSVIKAVCFAYMIQPLGVSAEQLQESDRLAALKAAQAASVDTRIARYEKLKRCIGDATDEAGIKACRKTHHDQMKQHHQDKKAQQAEQRETRRARLQQRIAKLQAELDKLEQKEPEGK